MAITLQNEQNIGTGWPGPPQLQGQNLGQLVAAILHDKLQREKMSGESIAETIKNVRLDMQSNKYIESMKEAGLIPKDYDAGGFGGAKLGEQVSEALQRQQRIDLETGQQKYMKPYYEAQTNEAAARADALWKYGTTGRGGGGIPRYDYNGVQVTGEQLLKHKREDRAAAIIGALTQQEANAATAKARIEAKYGLDPNTGYLRQSSDANYQTDAQEWERLDDEIRSSKIKRQNYEKWYKTVIGIPGQEPDTGVDDEEGVDIPPASSPPPTTAPALPTATPFPTATPAPTTQPTASPAISPAQQEPQASPTPAPTATPRPRGTPQTKMPPQKFSSVKDAIASGYKVNDIILLLHPQYKRYMAYQITEADLQ